jgi:hypothetical protein
MAKRGGYMPGGGRPKGSKGKKTQELLGKAMAEGITPMEVLLNDMRYFHKLAEKNLAKIIEHETIEANLELFNEVKALKAIARECAEKVSPYIHPKLSSIDAKVSVSNQETALAELE